MEERLRSAMEVSFVDVKDTSGGCGAMFELILVSPSFEGVGLLDRHRMVNEALAEELKSIHALSMKTWTPAQWENKKKGYQ